MTHMRTSLLISVLVIISSALLILPLAHAAEPVPAASVAMYLPLIVSPVGNPFFEQQVVDLTNQLRAQHGCGPLTVATELIASARGHSQDMAGNNFFSHTGSDGSQFWERIARNGYDFLQAAENLAAGQSSPRDVVMGWYNEPPDQHGRRGHRENMLNCALHDVGVGFAENPASTYRYYWSQDFGTR